MPGTPTSQACEPCKKRKTKCDQKWPTCGRCLRTKTKCPGPSSLFKFVTNNRQGAGKKASWSPAPSDNVGINPLSKQPTWARQPTSSKAGGVGFHVMSFRPALPRPMLTTVADRVAANLVHHLYDAPERGMITQTATLTEFPQRLHVNASFRDSIALLCSVWGRFRRGQPAVEFIDMPEYGRAIRSLSRTLQSDQAFSAETLAAITMLQRSEDLFDPGQRQFRHEQGLTSLLERLGPPEPDDLFYGSIVCETYSILIPYWIQTGWNDFFSKREWSGAIVDRMAEYMDAKQMTTVLNECFDQYNIMCADMPQLLTVAQSLQDSSREKDPPSAEYISVMTENLKIKEEMAESMAAGPFDMAMELGKVTEHEDTESLVGTSYRFTTGHLAQCLLSFLSFRIYILRIRCEWCSVYQEDDAEELFDVFREACKEVWKYIPYMRSTKGYMGQVSQGAIALTIEMAEEYEKDYLIDVFAEVDRYGTRAPRSRESLEKELLSHARLSTGRSR